MSVDRYVIFVLLVIYEKLEQVGITSWGRGGFDKKGSSEGRGCPGQALFWGGGSQNMDLSFVSFFRSVCFLAL